MINTIYHQDGLSIVIDRRTGKMYKIQNGNVEVIAQLDQSYIRLNFTDDNNSMELLKLIEEFEG